MLLKLEGFWFAMYLDHTMGYYHVQLPMNGFRIFTIVFPWGKYEYFWTPMGVSVASKRFQEKINDLFHSFEHMQAYMYGVILTTKNDWENHLVKIERILLRLAEAGLKVNHIKIIFRSLHM